MVVLYSGAFHPPSRSNPVHDLAFSFCSLFDHPDCISMATAQYIPYPRTPLLQPYMGHFPHPKRSVIFGLTHPIPSCAPPPSAHRSRPTGPNRISISSTSFISTAQPVAPHSRVCFTIPSPENRQSSQALKAVPMILACH